MLYCSLAFAQDSAHFRRDSLPGKNDTTRAGKRRDLTALFADTARFNSSDYQLRIENAYSILSMIGDRSELGPEIMGIREKLADSDTALSVLKENILFNSRALNLRNLQLFRTLLSNIHEDIVRQRGVLDSAEAMLTGLRRNMKQLVTDTVLRELMRDSVNRQLFLPQLKEMRQVWKSSTSQLKESLAFVNQLQTHNSANAVTTGTLTERVNDLLVTSFARVFGKEYNYIWQPPSDTAQAAMRRSFKKAYDGERKALGYYFKDSVNKRLFLLLIGLVFFILCFRNIRRLQKSGLLAKLKELDISYVYPYYIASTLVVIFILAPLFDLSAPSVYIESMQFLLLLTLTYICWRKWPRKLFVYWLVILVLYLCFSFTHHVLVPNILQRCWLIVLNVVSILFGYMFLRGMAGHLQLRGFLRFVIILHNVMNMLAIVCNIFGRFSLAQILGNAAIFSFTQAIGLAVFSQIVAEGMLLQIEGSRIRQGAGLTFEFQDVLKAFQGPVFFLVVLLWLIVFMTNLEIFNISKETFVTLMQQQHQVGSATFTMGGVLLFFFIIWLAHLLQKQVGYFFGDTGSEEVQNKQQRSRMLITRLIVLCLGYLLAVAASGLPVDKITIVLGALGVGIGLGLQNIVNNFVSGIILIFDRPLQIGDSIEIGDKAGRVREIGLRASTLLTSDGAEVIIPNGDILSQQITNWTLTNNRQRQEFSLSLQGPQDIEKIITVVKETIAGSGFSPAGLAPQILFSAINKDEAELKVHFWCKDVAQAEEARSAVLYALHQRLDMAGVSIRS